MSGAVHSTSTAGLTELRTTTETTWRQALAEVKGLAAQALVDLVVAPAAAEDEDASRDDETTDDGEPAAGEIDDEDRVVEPERGQGRTRRGKRGGRRRRRGSEE